MLPNLHNNQWAEAAKQFFTAVSVQNALAFIRMILSECSMDIRGKTVIDAGCGLGQNTMLFALLGAEKVYGVDLDEERISAFRLALESWRRVSDTMDRVELVVEDIMTYIPGRKADLMFCNEMLSHLWDRKAFYKKTSGMLSGGGGGGGIFFPRGKKGGKPKSLPHPKGKRETPGRPRGKGPKGPQGFL
uniref:Methyltransferase domain-containing protein n=1 Tax=Candidatus Desulfatibia profunda TaxID=2841695 RepID=A0A8J6NJS0_9BACT|nr:methyltransferase domain-containing protein [Candidatus Desulfatibia profunda]